MTTSDVTWRAVLEAHGDKELAPALDFAVDTLRAAIQSIPTRSAREAFIQAVVAELRRVS